MARKGLQPMRQGNNSEALYGAVSFGASNKPQRRRRAPNGQNKSKNSTKLSPNVGSIEKNESFITGIVNSAAIGLERQKIRSDTVQASVYKYQEKQPKLINGGKKSNNANDDFSGKKERLRLGVEWLIKEPTVFHLAEQYKEKHALDSLAELCSLLDECSNVSNFAEAQECLASSGKFESIAILEQMLDKW